jgi:diguanylate cyclase (GGDEF)-like protein/PAS domain S-box-containing protein
MDVVPHRAGMKRLPQLAGGFVALVCAAIIAVSAWSEWASREKELSEAEIELGNLARSLTEHAEDTFELGQSLLTGIVLALESEAPDRDNVTRLQAVLNARRSSLGRIRGLFVYDDAGRWLATTETVDLTAFNNSDRDYFRYHRQSADRSMLIGRPVHSKSGGQWVITLSRRWNHADGSFGGVVLATIDASYFSDYYKQFDLGPQGAIALVNRDGIVMARSPRDQEIGRDISRAPFFQGSQGPEVRGAVHFQSVLDGMPRLGSFNKSDRYPMVVLVSKTKDDVLESWRHEAGLRFALVLGVDAMLALIGIFLVRQLVRGRHLAIELASQEADFRMIAEGSSDIVTRIGMDGTIRYASPATFRILGWHPQELSGQPALAGVNAMDVPHLEEVIASLRRGDAEEARVTYRTRRRGKGEIWAESALRVTRNGDGQIDGVVAITRDVTQQKDLQVKLETLAIEDGLTGLANRRRFDERLREEWGRAYRERSSLALLMIDLDHFKAFNDTYGHQAGDECLHAFAGILADEARRGGDLVARYGGEEFALLLPNTDAEGCARVGELIRRALRAAAIPHEKNQPTRRVSASLGGAVCRPGTERSAGPASLVEAADRALYAAKDAGRDRLMMADDIVTLRPAANG